ncbi:MAG: lipoate--protein ligase family protein [Euryarchaeota archaeon]|nr:lipoate--protein ligase family protein [Euryarchaeota archaeon]
MSDAWRFLFHPRLETRRALGLRALREEGGLRDAILLLGYSEPMVSIGAFQDIDTEVDLEEARRRSIVLFRRSSGGGFAFIDPRVYMTLGFTGPPGWFPGLEEAMEATGRMAVEAIRRLGCPVDYKPVGDIVSGPRKVAAVVASRLPAGFDIGIPINLGPADFAPYEKVCRIPPEKFADKPFKETTGYLTNLSELAGREVRRQDVQDAFAWAFARAFGVEVEMSPARCTPEEERRADELGGVMVSPERLQRVSSRTRFPRVPPGHILRVGRHKARKLITAHVLSNGSGHLAEVMFTGDFFLRPTDGLAGVERAVASAWGTPRLQPAVADALQPLEAPGLTAGDFITAVQKAVGNPEGAA